MLQEKSPVDLSIYNTGGYKPGSAFKRAIWYLISRFFFETFIPYPSRFKVMILRLVGARVGRGVVIKPAVKIKYPWFLHLGDYVWIGERAWIDNLAMVRLGNNCCLSQEAYLLTGNHDYKDFAFGLMVREINVMDGAWIGARAIVCPGLTVNVGAVLCAGSVAVTDLDAMKIYQGNPATIVRDRKVRK